MTALLTEFNNCTISRAKQQRHLRLTHHRTFDEHHTLAKFWQKVRFALAHRNAWEKSGSHYGHVLPCAWRRVAVLQVPPLLTPHVPSTIGFSHLPLSTLLLNHSKTHQSPCKHSDKPTNLTSDETPVWAHFASFEDSSRPLSSCLFSSSCFQYTETLFLNPTNVLPEIL